MAISIPPRFRDDEAFATDLVKRYLATDATGRARYSGAHFERIGGGGDRPKVADQFTTDDLLALTMLSVRIEGYHALEILNYRAGELNDLLAEIPVAVALQDPAAGALIAEGGPAWKLWDAICDIEPRLESNRIGQSRPASSWHASARTCFLSTTVASRRFSKGPDLLEPPYGIEP